MAKERFTFELKAGLVSTVVGGRSIDITRSNSPYSTTDEEEAAALRLIDGLKEVTSSTKEHS